MVECSRSPSGGILRDSCPRSLRLTAWSLCRATSSTPPPKPPTSSVPRVGPSAPRRTQPLTGAATLKEKWPKRHGLSEQLGQRRALPLDAGTPLTTCNFPGPRRQPLPKPTSRPPERTPRIACCGSAPWRTSCPPSPSSPAFVWLRAARASLNAASDLPQRRTRPDRPSSSATAHDTPQPWR